MVSRSSDKRSEASFCTGTISSVRSNAASMPRMNDPEIGSAFLMADKAASVDAGSDRLDSTIL